MLKVYEVIVERKIRNRFTVEARSGTEASMKVGALLSRDGGQTCFDGSEEQETDRRILTPHTVEAAGPAAQQSLDVANPARDDAPPADVAKAAAKL